MTFKLSGVPKKEKSFQVKQISTQNFKVFCTIIETFVWFRRTSSIQIFKIIFFLPNLKISIFLTLILKLLTPSGTHDIKSNELETSLVQTSLVQT